MGYLVQVLDGVLRAFLQNVSKAGARMVRMKRAQFLKDQPTNLLDAEIVRYGHTIVYDGRPFMTEPQYAWQSRSRCLNSHRANKTQGDGLTYCEGCGEKIDPLLQE